MHYDIDECYTLYTSVNCLTPIERALSYWIYTTKMADTIITINGSVIKVNWTYLNTFHILKTYCTTLANISSVGENITIPITDIPTIDTDDFLNYEGNSSIWDLIATNNTNLTVTSEIFTELLQQATDSYYTTLVASIGIICSFFSLLLLRCDLAAGMRTSTYYHLTALFFLDVSKTIIPLLDFKKSDYLKKIRK